MASFFSSVTGLDLHIEGGDLLSQEAIRSIVRETYGGVGPTDRRVAERSYLSEELAGLPEETVRMALGIGNPVRHADLRLGEDVVDLGSGGGIDCLLAGRAVGPSGSVVGVDFLSDMVARATAAAAVAGSSNVRFVEGLIEELPLGDDTVDVIISNGVVNLSPRKVRVFAEAFRVLRPGGRLAIVDLVLEHDLPPEILTQPAAWAGCVAGALAEDDFVQKLEKAGFDDVEIVHREPLSIDDCALYPLFTDQVIRLMRQLIPPEKHRAVAVAVVIRAVLRVP